MKILSALCALILSSSASAAFKIPAMSEVILDNGLRIIYIPQSETPLVNISFAVRAGSVLDGQQWGLASLASAGVDLGTKSYSKKDLEDAFDQNGFSLESNAGKEFLTIDVASTAEDVSILLPYLAQLVRYPTYPQKEVERLRDRSVSQLRKGKESPNQIANEVFERLYFGMHPYGHPDDGVAETLKDLRATDLRAFHKAFFQPQISALVVAGDFDQTKIQDLIVKLFASWPKGSAVPAEIKQPAAELKETQVVLFDKPDARETTFRIGGKGVTNLNPDWPHIAVINTILGGRFTSLLNDALRVKSGYTYGARSRFNEYRAAGTFSIATFTANETTFKALDLALETYRHFVTKGIDQKTLDSAKAYVKGQFPPQYETLASLNSLAVELWAFGESIETFNSFETKVNSLTLDEANRLIKVHMPQAKLQILMIGKASEIAERAKSYGKFRQLPLARVDQAGLL